MDEDIYTLRKMKDFLLIYNKMAETCFNHCVNSLGSMNLTKEELDCVEHCCGKGFNTNHKVMQVYMEIQPEIINRRMEEAEKQTQKQVPLLTSENVLEEKSTQ